MENNKLTEFNVGETHSENPRGGIPQGKNNTVEQGESKIGNYIYSNRLSIDENTAKDMNLPSYVKGKTYADASKIIDKKFKDRNDKPSMETRKTLLGRLTQAQEAEKAKRQAEAEQINQSMQANSQQVSNQDSGDIPEGMEQFVQPQQKQMFLGGDLDNAEGAEGSGYTAAIQPAMAGINSLIAGDNDGALSAGIETGTTLAGTAIGGPIGGMIGSQVGKLASGFITGISAKKEAKREANRQAFKASNQFSNDFAYGGPLEEDTFPKGIYDSSNLGFPNGQYAFTSARNPVSSIDTTGLKQGLVSNNLQPTTSLLQPSNSLVKSTLPVNSNSGIGDYLDKNGGKFLKYAPVAMNAFQLSQLKKPKAERLDRLSNTYNPSYVDERNLQNTVSNENDNTINALTNATNGSEGALRSNILGANLNYTKGMSDAYLKANELNNAQKQYKQQFDLGVNQANMSQSNAELDINDRNTANYDTQKSKLLGSIGTDLGAIGKEEVEKNQIAEALGYSWDGKYMVNKKTGVKKTYEQVLAEKNSTPSFGDPNKFVGTSITSNMYGGYLRKNNKGY